MKQSRMLFVVVVGVILSLIATTFPLLLKHTKIGLEFRGGYEIVYQAQPAAPGGQVDADHLLATARILEERANKLGVAEPAVNVLGRDQIKVELAGAVPGDGAIQDLQDPTGLPLAIHEKYSETVGGVLGAGDLHDTMRAGLIALGVIALFLLAVYRGMGLIAVFTTLVSFWLLLAAFVTLHATLSLAAIVAFVLGLGISSDANIISFERIRDALKGGRPVGEAIRMGSKRSFRTLIDANATLLVLAVILLAAGIGPIKGFALTTLLAAAFSFVANVLLAHWLAVLWLGDNAGNHLFGSRQGHQTDKIMPFLGAGRLVALTAVVFIGFGGYKWVSQPLNLDIEFKPGTALDIQIDRPITQEAATDLIDQSGIAAATVAVGGKQSNAIAARFDDVLDTEAVNKVVGKFKAQYGPRVTFAENTADPSVARDLARRSIGVVALALLGAVLFVWWRFNARKAIASTVSVLAATATVFGAFAIFHLEIDITFIAAILIVIGYAINEVVVVFDRVRDHAGHVPPAMAADRAATQVARRSLFTVVTVLTGAASLYLFGAEPLQMFSLAIMIGLAAGMLYSLFIAPLVWSWLAQQALAITAAQEHTA